MNWKKEKEGKEEDEDCEKDYEQIERIVQEEAQQILGMNKKNEER